VALKLDYVFRETGVNLKRNFTLTLASVLAVAVSLVLVGASLLIRQGVENATVKWKGNVDLIVYMKSEVTPAQLQAMERALRSDADVKTIRYLDKTAAYKEFKQLFKDQPEMIDAMTPNDIPTSFKVVPRHSDYQSVSTLKLRYDTKPGVFQVVAATDAIKSMQQISGVLSSFIIVGAIVLLGAAILLILNTIRMAMFARRREIEVMKLVGATNWFIRVPFMLEGLVQGVVGAGIAVGGVFGLNYVFRQRLASRHGVELLQSFVVANHDVIVASSIIATVGILVGVLGSALAVTRFLDV